MKPKEWTGWLAVRAVVALALTSCASGAGAQAYPARPVRIVVPFPAGGGADFMARVVGQKLGDALGQTFVVDNRAGAAGVIGTDMVAKSAADGYTLVLGTTGTHATNPAVLANLPYDPARGFRADFHILECSVRAMRASVAAGKKRARADCIRKKTFGGADLRFFRHRQLDAPRFRVIRVERGNKNPPHSV